MLNRHYPTGVLRSAFRLPIWLYRWHMGWLLGNRFLLLAHRGRKSGQTRTVVLEVVRADPKTHEFVIASGYGEHSQWFQNITQTPEVGVTSGRWHGRARAERLTTEQAEDELRIYARRHPLAFRELIGFMTGKRFHGTDDDFTRLAREIPLLLLHASKQP